MKTMVGDKWGDVPKSITPVDCATLRDLLHGAVVARRGTARSKALDADLFSEVCRELGLRLRVPNAITLFDGVARKLCPWEIPILLGGHHWFGREREVRDWIDYSTRGWWSTTQTALVFEDKASAALFKVFWC